MLALTFSLGIVFQNRFQFEVFLLFATAVFYLILVTFVLFFRRGRSAVFLILGLCVLCGGLWFAVYEELSVSYLSYLTEKRLSVHGIILNQPKKSKGKIVCDLMVDRFQTSSKQWQEVPGEKIRVYFFKNENSRIQAGELAYGHSITVHGKLVLPQEKRNPGDFDYRKYLKSQKINCLLYVYEDGRLVVDGSFGGNRLVASVMGVRESFSRLVRTKLPERQAVLLLAMLFGEQDTVFEEDINIVREMGIAHALSVSGLHVGLVLLLILTLCRSVGAGPKLILVVSIGAMCIYGVLSSFSVTVIRATIMGVIGLLAYHFDRERNIYIALSASGLAILIWNPLYVFDPGFQLSFSAVWALAYLGPFLGDILPQFIKGRSSLVTIPLAAQLGTLPIVAWHFNTVSLFAVFTNILLVPVISAIVITGLFSFIVSFVSAAAADTFLQTTGFLINLLVSSGELFSRLPRTEMFVASPSFFFLALYYGVLIFLREIRNGRIDLTKTVGGSLSANEAHGLSNKKLCQVPGQAESIVILIGILSLACWPWGGTKDLCLYFIDVGQGDAILIRGPSGNTALVDGGGMPGHFQQGYDPGKDTVIPFLHYQGINSINLLINTHPDEDHLDGLEDVLEVMPVGKLITPPVTPWQDKYFDFLNLARQKGTAHLELTQGSRIKLDEEVFFEVLGPERGDVFQVCNDTSLVLKVCHGSNSFLLLGDLESEGIEALLGKKGDLNCTLLKIPHHGGKSSFNEVLYKEANPKIVLISVGKNNTFGHPSKEVIEYWQKSGVQLCRTDLNGCVIVTSDGRQCTVKTIK